MDGRTAQEAFGLALRIAIASPAIGIVGFGRLGSFLGRQLARDFKVLACDPKVSAEKIRAAGVEPSDAEVIFSQSVVLLCVPIRRLEQLLRDNGKFVKADALVMDMASVKERPAALMRRFLPKGAEIIAAHPAFGPDSAAQSLKGQKFVLCPERVSRRRLACVKSYLRRKGLKIIETSAKEHDRQMAQTLVLTHFIGRGLIAFGAGDLEMDTEGYKRLMRILQTVQNDTWELFEDMNRFNRFAQPVRRGFAAALGRVERRLRA